MRKVFCVLFSLHGFAYSQDLHVSRIEEIRYTTGPFEIRGNLYLPRDTVSNGLIVWIHGSGPDLRTKRFPGTAFFNCFLDNGFAYFRHDNPGFGDSKGTFTDSLLFQQRASIVGGALDLLKRRPGIDSTKIGLVGSSQAGYVMPLVLASRTDVAFIVGLSVPAETGHEQWAYLLKMQLIHEGYPTDKAAEWSAMHLKLIQSQSHEAFLETVEYFKQNPICIPALKGYDSSFAASLDEWWPLDWARPQSFNPMPLMANLNIPVLILYGEKDTQVDPLQGGEAYRKILSEAGNPFFEVKIIPNADHNMSLAESGSLKEQQTRKESRLAPGFVQAVAEWVQKLKARWDDR